MGKLPKIVGRGMPHPTLSVALSCGKVIVEILENVLILHLSLKKKKKSVCVGKCLKTVLNWSFS